MNATKTRTAKPTRTMTYERCELYPGIDALTVTVRDERKHTTEYQVFARQTDEGGARIYWSRNNAIQYQLTLSPTGQATGCTCPARVKCRHEAGTETLASRGEIKHGK